MGKTGIIIRREFNERVRKKSFILTTLLTPLLLVGVMLAPAFIMNARTSGVKEIVVADGTGVIADKLQGSRTLQFTASAEPGDELKASLQSGALEGVFGVLVIGSDVAENPRNVQLYSREASTLEMETAIARQVQGAIEAEKLKHYNIDNLSEILAEVRTPVSLTAYRTDTQTEKESSSAMSLVFSFVFGLLIYMFIILYGSMVMSGVIEEKSSKVLEIMVSSVKPFQLMMGKIIGIASVALTQLLIWIVLIAAFMMVAVNFLSPDMAAQAGEMMGQGMSGLPAGLDADMLKVVDTLTDPGFILRMLGGFIIYFVGGYLLYSAMFAAVGSAVDNAADSQQLQLPITIPLILAIFVMMNVVSDPHSSLAVWFSIIPFTSPIIMMARLPYGVPGWELILSMALLYATFLLFVWLAGKIYRVGIFMYGKKPTLKEVLKWSRYKY